MHLNKFSAACSYGAAKKEEKEILEVGEKESGEEEVVIILSETETISLLDIPSSVVVDPGQQESVQKNNHLYQEVS